MFRPDARNRTNNWVRWSCKRITQVPPQHAGTQSHECVDGSGRAHRTSGCRRACRVSRTQFNRLHVLAANRGSLSRSGRDRPVNFSGSVNQRFREFGREISGCGRNLEGPFQTPEVLSRNRERVGATRIVANPCQNWPITRNARQSISRRRALTGRWFLSAEKKRAPPTGLEPVTRWLTATCSTN